MTLPLTLSLFYYLLALAVVYSDHQHHETHSELQFPTPESIFNSSYPSVVWGWGEVWVEVEGQFKGKRIRQ